MMRITNVMHRCGHVDKWRECNNPTEAAGRAYFATQLCKKCWKRGLISAGVDCHYNHDDPSDRPNPDRLKDLKQDSQ